MKKSHLVIATILVLQSVAAVARIPIERNVSLNLICHEINSQSRTKLSIKLRALQTDLVEKEGKLYPYQLELKDIYPLGIEVLAVPTLIKGQSWSEDVQTYFESDDKKVKLNMYRDELDQTTLEENGKETRFDCN